MIKNKIWKISERIIIVVSVIIITALIVRAVDFKTSATLEKAAQNACPPNMISITAPSGGFCLDEYEVSAGTKCPVEKPNSQDDSFSNIDYPDCQPEARPGAIPWTNISENQAAIACAKAGKRLPTNKEWQQAALGTPDQNANWGVDDCDLNKNWASQPGPAGSGKNCHSGSGIYDLVGNVWEWVEGTIIDGQYENRKLPDSGFIKSIGEDGLPLTTDPEQADKYYFNDYFWIKPTEPRAIARGGYWSSGSDGGQYSAYVVLPPSLAGPGIGFRCAK